MNDFENDIKISDNLAYEWNRQAELYLKYGLEFVRVQAMTFKKKEKFDYVQAELDAYYRKEAALCGEKITERALSGKIANDPKYRNANAEYLDAKANEGKWSVVKMAFEHKKKALEYKSQFLISGIYANPKQKRGKDGND
jgi:hypothetical protein